MKTVTLELVPPNIVDGTEKALDEAFPRLGHRGSHWARDDPGLIEEEHDRPVEMKRKMDVADFCTAIQPELPGVRGWARRSRPFLTRQVPAPGWPTFTSAGSTFSTDGCAVDIRPPSPERG